MKFKEEVKYTILIGVTVFGMMRYVHANFLTQDIGSLIIQRLDRIESKLDSYILKDK